MNHKHTSPAAPRTNHRRSAVLTASLLGLLLPITACSGSDADAEAMPDIAALSKSAEVDCNIEELENEPTCYEITVPEDWSNPDDKRQVVLKAVVFHATGDAAVDDPMIYLQGGPGGPVLEDAAGYAGVLVDPYLEDRDVILFDQRGVGESQPNLECDETYEFQIAVGKGEIAQADHAKEFAAANKACYERLATDGVNFDEYNSIASSHDIDAIRTTLGYEKLNVLGISYGTRLAQTYMRLYPSSLRSVIIDSVEPVASAVDELIPVSANRAFEMLFEACAKDEGCAKTYPNFKSDYFALLDQLDETPAEVEVPDADGNTQMFRVDGDYLFGLTFNALYDKSTFSAIPQMVSQAQQGDYQVITALAANYLGQWASISQGMYNSVVCNEEVPFESADDLAKNIPTDGDYRRESIFEDESNFQTCPVWEAGKAPAVEDKPVESDIPTLLLTGSFDPITPPSYAREVADHLKNSYLFEFPTEGHGVAPSECGSEIAQTFLDDPTAEPDASCIADVTPPEFVPPSSADTKLIPFEVSDPFALTGVRPEGWSDMGFGVFQRQSSMNDTTAVIAQPTNAPSTDAVFERFGITPTEQDPTEVDGAQWATFGGEVDGIPYRVMFSPENEYVVLIQGSPEEIDDLIEHIAIPIAASLKTP